MPIDSIPRRLFDQARTRPNAPAYYAKIDGSWRSASWQDYASEVRRAAKALVALGLAPEKSVAILGFNRPEWAIFAFGAMAAGGAPAGIYTTSSAEEVRYIVHHAAAPVVLVENTAQWTKIERELERLPLLRHVVMMKGAPRIEHPKVLGWEAFLDKGAAVADADIDARLDSLEPNGLATLIYTSGTTGPPKGVMLSHRNLAWTADAAKRTIDAQGSDVVLSYLPLSHIAEQMFTLHGAATAGYAVYYAESIDKLLDDLKEVQPTFFFGVPRIWEKFQAGIEQKLADLREPRKTAMVLARRVGANVTAIRNAGREPKGALAAAYEAARRLVFVPLKQAIGLARARVCVVGAAPVAKEVLEFFGSIDVRILEVYGQSEVTGPTSFNLPNRARFGTVGPVLDGVEVKLADDGEILVRGPNVFLGYHKDPVATSETLVDGWLHSGDLGAFDADGFLTITGRKKDIIITAGGKNITPKNIEDAIKQNPLVADAVVIGDRRKYLTALVTLEPEAARRFAAERGEDGQPPHQLRDVEREIQRTIDEVNRTFARVEQIKRFRILPRAFSVDSGEVTPTLKLKRNVITQHFASEIESMYASEP